MVCIEAYHVTDPFWIAQRVSVSIRCTVPPEKWARAAWSRLSDELIIIVRFLRRKWHREVVIMISTSAESVRPTVKIHCNNHTDQSIRIRLILRSCLPLTLGKGRTNAAYDLKWILEHASVTIKHYLKLNAAHISPIETDHVSRMCINGRIKKVCLKTYH
jgi:hypothetical protein